MARAAEDRPGRFDVPIFRDVRRQTVENLVISKNSKGLRTRVQKPDGSMRRIGVDDRDKPGHDGIQGSGRCAGAKASKKSVVEAAEGAVHLQRQIGRGIAIGHDFNIDAGLR